MTTQYERRRMEDGELYQLLGEINTTLKRLVSDFESNTQQFERLRDRVDNLEDWKIRIMGGLAGIALCSSVVGWAVSSQTNGRINQIEGQAKIIESLCRHARKENPSMCYGGAGYE